MTECSQKDLLPSKGKRSEGWLKQGCSPTPVWKFPEQAPFAQGSIALKKDLCCGDSRRLVSTATVLEKLWSWARGGVELTGVMVVHLVSGTKLSTMGTSARWDQR